MTAGFHNTTSFFVIKADVMAHWESKLSVGSTTDYAKAAIVCLQQFNNAAQVTHLHGISGHRKWKLQSQIPL